MNIEQYIQLTGQLSDNIFGQKFSFVYVNDFRNSIRREFKDREIKKVSYILAHIAKKSYYDMANTSTGLKKLGVEMKQLRESQYNYEKLNGLFASLKSNPEKKYILVRYDNDPDRKNIEVKKVVYIDKNNQVLDVKTVESMMTPSSLKHKNNEYGRSAKLELSVGFKVFKWSDIAKIKIAGQEMSDNLLNKYSKYVNGEAE